ncbi:MAG: hypothetical protein Q8L51_00430 [Candidatus Amesbacteria bacterium]|nr:hypothetical protein [Candidatus Amesbacteria bacterium]
MKTLVVSTTLNFFLVLLILYPLYFALLTVRNFSWQELLLSITIIINALFCFTIQILILTNKFTRNKINYKWYLVCQVLAPYLLFAGYFFVETWLFPIGLIITLSVIWILMFRVNIIFTIIATVVFTLGAGLMFFAGFEEGYCVKIGSRYGNEMKYDLKDYEIRFLGSGAEVISMSLRKHLECHQTFRWGKAIMDNYFKL